MEQMKNGTDNMLVHEQTAAAIQLWYGGDDYKKAFFDNLYFMTIALTRSIRDIGYSGDIVIITNTDKFDYEFSKEGLIIEKREIFDYPARLQYKCCAPGLSLFDMQKIQYWSLTNYRKVIGLDNDMIAIKEFDFWAQPELGACFINGPHTDINSGILFLDPSEKTFNNMYHLATTSTFSPETGWNNCGPICDIKRWDFQAANAAQGFMPYYFREKIHNNCQFQDYFAHFAGPAKYKNPMYQRELARHGFKLTIPPHVT